MEQGPNAVRLGLAPSSCQVIEDGVPAAILVEETGSVIWRVVSPESWKKLRGTDENVRMGKRSQGSKRKNEERRKHC
jgi:hypothetical protein